MRRTALVAAILFAAYLALGALGYVLTEPGAGFGRGVRWALVVLTTLGTDVPPTNQVSAWFQVGYAVLTFMLVSLALSTVVIPPILHWWDARVNGLATMRWWQYWRKKLFLLVDPVDWEKAESVIDELDRQFQGNFVVVVSNDGTFPNLPGHLLGKVVYVKGNLRDPLTYRRAGLDRAAGAFICSSSYDDPASDLRTAAIVSVIEGLRPEIITVAEQVSHANDDLFKARDGFSVDATVVFDRATLQTIAERLARLVGNRRVGVVNANTVDDLQQSELELQLEAAGMSVVGDGETDPLIVLPSTLDDTAADFGVWSSFGRAETAGKVVVALYLSIKSEGLFAGRLNAVCADRVMAQALVAEMRRLLAKD
jgi:hypothetical protein